MIPYMVGKLAPNSSHLTRGLVKYVSGRGYFRTVPSPNGDKIVTSPPHPFVEWVGTGHLGKFGTASISVPGVPRPYRTHPVFSSSIQLDREQDWHPFPVDLYSVESADHTFMGGNAYGLPLPGVG